MTDQLTLEDAVILIQVYQKRLNDVQAQCIALEARTIRQQQQLNAASETINNLQQQLQKLSEKPQTTRKVNTKKAVDSREFS
tara:strand:+ start:796 stop:1041 length:246 start_codon:yes stop_codon:yes gene_type:complete